MEESKSEKIKNEIIEKTLPLLLKSCKKSLREIRNIHTMKEVGMNLATIGKQLNDLKIEKQKEKKIEK